MPSPEECITLLEEAGCSDDVIEHVLAVHELAVAMANRTDVDDAVVEAGSLLHDVGRGFDQGPLHVPKGVEFLQEKGVDERVVDCVARHMGAGLSQAEAAELGFPEGVWAPQRMEEKIVSHADNLTGGASYRDLDTLREKYKAQDLEEAWLKIQRLHRELSDALGQDPAAIARSLDT